MLVKRPLWALALLIGLVLFVSNIFSNVFFSQLLARENRYEADGFEYGRGSITLGCSFSYRLPPEPYGLDNPYAGTIILGLRGNDERPPSLRVIVDGPKGTTILIGEGCQASIDWSFFPLKGD